ncbi:MAG: metallophosphoesterase [Lentisphaeria bacterium]|nr:metallophosphoesterase [Lentisphaeria bacterium]
MKSGFRHKVLIFLLGSGLLFCAAGRELTLKIIQTTDLHGYIAQDRLARVAALVEDETRSAGGPEKSIRIDCGDLIQGSYPMTLPEGRSLMIRCLNLLQYDVFVPGNHDFEFGSAVLLPLLRRFTGTVLAANLDWPNAPVSPWKMFSRNGIDVAVIGIAYPSLERMFIPPVLGPARTLSVEKQLELVMPQVIRARPDLIVLALHAGEHGRFSPGFLLFDLIRKYPQIDLVLCGHTHQPEPGRALGNSWLLQAPPLAQGAAVADIVYDPDRKKIVSQRTRIELVKGAPAGDGVSGIHDRVHPEVKKAAGALNSRTFRAMRHKIADVPFELRPPEKNEFRSHWTQLCGEAIMAGTGAQAAFFGGDSNFRARPGSLSEFYLYLLLPYHSYAVTVDLTPDELRSVLTEQLRFRKKKGMYQAPAGLRFTTVRGRLDQLKAEQLPQGAKTCRCAFSSYVFAGSGKYPVLHSILKRKKPEYSPRTIREMVADHLAKNYPAAGK